MCRGAWSSQIGPWCSTDNTQCPGPAQGPGGSSRGPSRRASRLVRQGPSWGLGASHRRGPSQTQARGLRPAYSPSKSCWHFSYQTYPANARTDVFRRPGGPGPRGAGPLGSRISPRLNFHGRAALKFSALNSHTHTHTYPIQQVIHSHQDPQKGFLVWDGQVQGQGGSPPAKALAASPWYGRGGCRCLPGPGADDSLTD